MSQRIRVPSEIFGICFVWNNILEKACVTFAQKTSVLGTFYMAGRMTGTCAKKTCCQ